MLIARAFCVCLLLLCSFYATAMDSQKYDARLCSAQLVVIKGDLRQFLHESTSAQQKDGYKQRIAGALGTLNWLCRQYISLHELPPDKIPEQINELGTAIASKNWVKANQHLNRLIDQMPLSLQELHPGKAEAESIKVGREIYKSYCQACHHQPYLDQARPAYSLFKMAKQLSQQEFIARMIIGVHGTPEIALQNPLTDDDIAGMFAYLLKAKLSKEGN